jgi:hypothetical protein
VLSKGLAWAAEALFRHLGIGPDSDAASRALLQRIADGSEPLAFEKTTSDNLEQALENYGELMEAAKQLYAEQAERQFHEQQAAGQQQQGGGSGEAAGPQAAGQGGVQQRRKQQQG